jgi:dienelactone hydrolase
MGARDGSLDCHIVRANLAASTAPISGHDPALERGLDYYEPRPLYFGEEGRPLFGWLHRCAAASLGVILCNPFGDENVRAHRSLRHLAIAISHAGIPVLRFDYDGTGDSAGHDLEPERVNQWLASIHAAADTLKQQTGVTHLCFVGLRLGATLATVAAADRTDVAGLLAIAPIVSGKAFVRELKLFQRAIDSQRNITGSATTDALESAGFLLAEQTQAALSSIDLLRAGKRPAPRVLILDRAEMPAGEKWAQKLRELDTQVEHSAVGGYAEMMLENHESIVPDDIIKAATHWLRELAASLAPSHSHTDGRTGSVSGRASERATITPSAVPDPVVGSTQQSPVEEHAVTFGDSNRLFGIVSMPKHKPGNSRAIVLLNSGAVPHIGPSRMHVTFARYLAELGYTVLRMDIASIGDSPPYPGQAEIDVYSSHALTDLNAAIEYLRRHCREREVISAGICSGAYHSFKAAVAHLPLNRVILINPLTFFWKPGMSLQYPEYRVAQDIQRYRTTALRLSTWRKLITGRVNVSNLVRVLVRGARARALGPIRALARSLGRPMAEDLPTELRAVLKASIDLQFVFSAGDPGWHLLQTQGGATARSLESRGQIGIASIEGANHTFTDLATRRTLLRVLVEKLSAKAPGASRSDEV